MVKPQIKSTHTEIYDFSNEPIDVDKPFEKCVDIHPSVQFCFTIDPSNQSQDSTSSSASVIANVSIRVTDQTVTQSPLTVEKPFSVDFGLASVNSNNNGALSSHLYKNDDGYYTIGVSYSSSEPTGVAIKFPDHEYITPFKD